MEQQQSMEPNPNAETLKQLRQVRSEARGDSLPVGDDPVEVQEPVQAVESQEVASAEASEAEVSEPQEAPKEVIEEAQIKIGDKYFKTQEEAIKYAEELEEEKLRAEIYNQGVREALQYSMPKPIEEKPVEEDFETKFYSNPKETLLEVQRKARDEAVQLIKAEQNAERLWSSFTDKYPDLAGSRALVERIVSEDKTLQSMKDLDKGFELVARKARAFYQDYMERVKPRTEMPKKQGQVVSSGKGSAPISVTPKENKSQPLDFASQLKMIRKRG